MPLYTFQCRRKDCAHEIELLASYREAVASVTSPDNDTTIGLCPTHAVALVWKAAPGLSRLGQPAFQFGLTTSTGGTIKGHVGRDAPRKRK